MRFLALLPLLAKKKRTWLLAAIVGYFMFSGKNDGIGFSQLAERLPDFSIGQFWKEPRDRLVDRVEDARDAQQETVEQFTSALEKFKAVTDFSGGDLEKQYNILNKAFERSETSAAQVGSRIDKVTDATNDLLAEWKEELKDYHDPNFRKRAEAQFDATRRRAEELIAAMRRAEERTKPVLTAFRDQVLYIKHNLNMQAIASLDEEAEEIKSDVGALIEELEVSIAEANAFIASLSNSG